MKALALTEYWYDYHEFSELIAVALPGLDGKAALIAEYHRHMESQRGFRGVKTVFPLFLGTEARPDMGVGQPHYAIEEVPLLGHTTEGEQE